MDYNIPPRKQIIRSIASLTAELAPSVVATQGREGYVESGRIMTMQSDGVAAICGASDIPIGVLEYPVFVGDSSRNPELASIVYAGHVRLWSDTPLNAGVKVFSAANGKISSTGTNLVGLTTEKTKVAGWISVRLGF